MINLLKHIISYVFFSSNLASNIIIIEKLPILSTFLPFYPLNPSSYIIDKKQMESPLVFLSEGLSVEAW